MKVWLVVFLFSFTFAEKPRFKQILCSIKFPNFATCVKDHAHSVLSYAMDTCKNQLMDNSTYSEFGIKACNSSQVAEMFITCIRQIKKENDFCGKIPKKCYEEVNIEKKITPNGLVIMKYFCDLTKKDKRERAERFCCLLKKAPKQDVNAMKTCQQKFIKLKQNEKFLTKICNPKNYTEMIIKLGEWKDCYMEAIGKNSTNCSPTYINECSKSTEPCKKRS